MIQSGKELKKGDEVIFTAKADTSYSIEKWTRKNEGGAEEIVNGDAQIYKLTMEQNVIVKVKFIDEKDLPLLKLTYLSINGEEVKDVTAGELSLSVSTDSQDRIYARDIVSEFTYTPKGSSQSETKKIKSWIKDGLKVLQYVSVEDEGTLVNLSVPGKKGEWQSWKGKVKIKKRIHADFKLNNLDKTIISQVEKKDGSFVCQQLQKIDVDNDFLHLTILNSDNAFKKIVVNGKDLTNDIKEYDLGSKISHALTLQNMTEGDDISVVVYPNEDTLAENHFSFKVKGKSNGQQKKIMPRLMIQGDDELPLSTFLDKLTGNTPPTWKCKENKAEIKIIVDEYTHDFLLEKVEIDTENQQMEEEQSWTGGFSYVVKKEIENLTNSPKLVSVKFTSKDESKAPSFEWKFNLQTGGTLRPIPQRRVNSLTINGDGKRSVVENTFESSFLDHLNDESKPLYVFDGNTDGKLEIKVGCYAGEGGKYIIEGCKCKIDGHEESVTKEEIAENQLRIRTFTCLKTIGDTQEHDVELELSPSDVNEYSNLVLKFKVKNSGAMPAIPDVRCYINRGLPQLSGYKINEPIDGELAELSVNTYNDVLGKVEIGAEGSLKEYPIYKFFSNKSGKYVYATESNVLLPTDGAYKKYIIKLYPNEANKDKYRITEFECYLKGKKIREDNAEFLYNDDRPYIYHENAVSWKNETAGTIREYGLKSVQIVASTVSPRAKVKYRLIDLEGNTVKMKGESVAEIKEMQTDNLGKHWADISFFDEKPAMIEAFVVSENGENDDNFGKWSRSYNYIPLLWGEREPESISQLKNYAYDEIKVDKSELKNEKLYVAFGVNADSGLESYKYAPSQNNEYQSYQTKPEKLEDSKGYTWYKFEVDVSTLTKENSLDVVIPILTNNELCYTYKVKLQSLR